MTRPPRLRPGDTVAVPAPASPAPLERLRAGLERLSARYRVRVDADAASAGAGRAYLAGSDERRADELNRFIADPDVRAIVIARGGYGIMRILDRLDAAALRADPKPIVGFSDGVALLSWARTAAGVAAVHGPVATQIGELPEGDVEWLFRLLEEPGAPGELAAGLAPIGAAAEPGAGAITVPLVGGNLTMVAHLVGTAYPVELAGCALMIEDIDERPYELDRYLTRLELAGALAGARAALVGDLVRCDSAKPDGPPPFAVVDERLRHLGLAGLQGLPVGHGARNRAFAFGGRCSVDFARGAVTLLDAAVT